MALPVVGLAGLLLLVAWPIVKRVLIALGIGWVTYQGLSLVGAQVQSEIVGLWGGMSGDMLRVASLLGLPQSLGIILGGLAGRVALAAVDRIGRVVA